jgi:O-acetyl-ADP-ribose deacetylase (regulator of RNase III)
LIIFVKVDVIIGSSSSENLIQILLKAAGDQIRTVYTKEQTANPNKLIITTPPGHLHCKQIFFLKWEPNKDRNIPRKFIIDLISNVVQNVLIHKYTSIAFPATGCGEHACSVDIIVKTMVRYMKQQIENQKLPWTVKFIVHPSQQNVYDEFCKQVLSLDHVSNDYQLPSTWERSDDDQLRFIVPENTDEYNSIINKFDEQMERYYTEIIKLERIQNERWYMQYIAHRKDFKKRLVIDTEKRLYHGSPELPADLIIKDCFNRSFAGVNGNLS